MGKSNNKARLEELYAEGDVQTLFDTLGTYGTILKTTKEYDGNYEMCGGELRQGVPCNTRTTLIAMQGLVFEIVQENGRVNYVTKVGSY